MQLIPTLQGGGAERQLALLATEHVKKGIEVAVVYHTDGPNLDYLKKEAVFLHRLPMRNNYDPKRNECSYSLHTPLAPRHFANLASTNGHSWWGCSLFDWCKTYTQ